MEILRVLVKRVAKRNHQMREAARSEDTADFIHHSLRRHNMFKDSVALNPCEHAGWKRQMMSVRLNIDARNTCDIEIDVSGDSSAGPSEIEIETPQRRVYIVLTWILN
jgi:hypothetical protein